MRKIKDVLRLKLQGGLSHERIAAALGISKGAVTKYCILAAACGLDWPSIAELSETALERRLLAGRGDRPSQYAVPDFGQVHQEMRRKGMTLTLLWEEYVEAHAQQPTWRYTQFCEHYRRYCLRLRRSMRQIHRAGEKLFVDYAGPTITLEGGGVANISVAALGASSFTYACATTRQSLADWLYGCGRALQFIGGVPQLIVPDNPRALINDPNRYEPRANETVEDFARHYGTSVLQARPYRPQDTAKVESAVQVVERWILMRLRKHTLGSVDDVNEAIAPLLDRLTAKLFQKLPEHLSAAHRAHLEWTPQRLIHWGNAIGPMTGHIVRRLLKERRHPEHGYRACLGLLSLARKYGKPRLEAACVIAAGLGTTEYSHVRDILANDRDRRAVNEAPEWNME